jgi:hypothetical protein
MSDGHHKLPPKKEVALALLEGPSMFVHLDPRRPGVLIPQRFRDKPQLVLQIGLNMFVPIPDLKVDDEGVSCTLSFDRAPFWCRMPWNAIYALVGEDGRGMMWPDDIPPEVVAQMQNPQQPQTKDKEVSKATQKRPRPKLSAVGSAPRARESRVEEKEEAPPVSTQTDASTKRQQTPPSDEARHSDGNAARASDGNAARSSDSDDAPPPPEPARRPSGSPGGRKPKRELPPYLRVIK